MCGIIGYVGNKQALPILLQGLRDLEYRGYDSAGIAVVNDGKINRVRSVGKIDALASKISGHEIIGTIGIAHTRWATHGGVTEGNAHPHVVMDGKLALVHNGIIENYRELREKLKGSKFSSETDSEVLAHLIASHYKGDLMEAVRKSLAEVRGTYGILVAHAQEPDKIVAARMGSPLVIGQGSGEYFVASDPTPLMQYTKQVTFLDDGEIASISKESVKIINLKDESVAKKPVHIDWDQAKAEKGGYEHFMLKEIFDQPVVFEDAVRGRLDVEKGSAHMGGLNLSPEQILHIKRIVIIASGTAHYAGLVSKYAFERLTGIPTSVEFSSEFKYSDPILDKHTLVFAVSQSGETADTLMAVREAKMKGAVVRAIVNVVGSTIAREAGAGSYIHAGPEMAVASTKAFMNMIVVLILNALALKPDKPSTSLVLGKAVAGALIEIPSKMNQILKLAEDIKKIAKKYSQYKNFFFLGRGVNYPTALEGSLKLKEISYIYSEGYAAGEMKHGPLALVSKDFPVVGILTRNKSFEKMKSSILEAKSRGAKTLIIATQGDKEAAEVADDIIYVPATHELLEPLLNTIPLQLFAYYVAVELGRDVDRPRNLAKSVTVE